MSVTSAFDPKRFHVLDGMRGIAAIIVMLYHYNMRAGSPFLHYPYLAVDFFFVLSGFVLMHSYGQRLKDGMTNSAYTLRRLVRLYPMLAIGIILGIPGLIFFTHLGHTNFSNSQILASAISNLMFIPYTNDRTFTFSDGIVIGELFPADGPLWSIFFELAASIAFIGLVRLSQARLHKFIGLSFFFVIVAAALNTFSDHSPTLITDLGWGTINVFWGFPRVFYGFALGMSLYQGRHLFGRHRTLTKRFPNLVALTLYAALISCLIFPHLLFGLFYIVSIVVIAPVLVWLGGSVSKNNNLVTKVSELLGWMSYGIYCLHKPVIVAAYWLNEKYEFYRYTGLSTEWQAVIMTLAATVLLTAFVDEPARKWLTKNVVKRFERAHHGHTIH